MSESLRWICRGQPFPTHRPMVMGIVNVTPDSFSDGGKYLDHDAAVRHALTLIEQGADILDIGGESTRPGSIRVSAEEQLNRILPVVNKLLRQTQIPLSIDTMSAEVAEQCLDLGASIVNDVSGLRADPRMRGLVAKTGAACVIMHMQGTPETMQQQPTYNNVLDELESFFAEQITLAEQAGIQKDSICLDVGIGFGKSLEHNLTILANLDRFRKFGRPLCLGVSRKKFLGAVCGRAVGSREAASLAMGCFAMAMQSAHVLRVHDVSSTRDAAMLYETLQQYRLH
jgi:dihydropteroate synthase